MKKFTLLLLSILLLSNISIQAQNWVNGGNALGANGTIGTNSNHSLLFETNNAERGRLTNTGLWGIGTAAPNARLHVNSAIGQNAFRVQVNGNTKLFVHQDGGVSVGANVTPPANGFYVSGLVGIGTTAPNSKVHINTIVNQDPLRVMYNGSTKMLVHRSGGVAIGGAVTPPANGLYVAGNAAIGTTTPVASTRLTVRNEESGTIGIIAMGDSYGLKAYSINDDELGYGIYAYGGWSGVHGEGDYSGISGSAEFGTGVYGYTDYGEYGVEGASDSGIGGYFHSNGENGLFASTNNSDFAYAGYFDGNVYSTGLYQGSDKNLKKNIKDIGNAMSLISQLKPSYYQFRDDGKYASLKLPKGEHFGLLAQDVEKILPNLIKETTHEVREHKPMPKPGPDGKIDFAAIKQARKEPKEKLTIKAVNYTEFIPILIKGMQEQQATIEKQAAEIAELTQLVGKLTQNPNSTGLVKPIQSYLSQSAPNPSKNSTRINYSLPANSTKAELVLYNSAGQQVKQIQLDNSGVIDINTSTLSAGNYSYSLYLNGELIESRKMLIVR